MRSLEFTDNTISIVSEADRKHAAVVRQIFRFEQTQVSLGKMSLREGPRIAVRAPKEKLIKVTAETNNAMIRHIEDTSVGGPLRDEWLKDFSAGQSIFATQILLKVKRGDAWEAHAILAGSNGTILELAGNQLPVVLLDPRISFDLVSEPEAISGIALTNTRVTESSVVPSRSLVRV